ncbi:2-C-methyl-D-erythritol 4-phosphate cytidylyltransferase [Serpentinicella sp. ANB-PHB4]|uniref:2-C-methyl-D-erythritol 4-phosphate cytidylyltransferase n=1 Tax=Serpentinicella sp. ANB-PHB4 TaxID=3074076 RepID=UPI00285F7B3D|nr:2-C-methyl-D-erythritol 4-phosphate cytidylyltransferase [Serpentinicella sp. ANB-PHB4]MDR5659916.1 2-C-methyl-D-erythritol 4-phosphate cytidylyltransferase [Serpentinicella sp. ANB-PHB4]
MNSVVVVAGGKGSRMGEGYNKQYISLNGKPLVAHTLEVFEKNININEIILVVPESEIMYCKENIIQKYNINKVSSIVSGGKERQDSVYQGLLAVNKECQVVLIHDGARPFVTDRIIDESIKKTQQADAVIVGVPVKDTVKLVDVNMRVTDTPDRKRLWSVQTPQTFKYEVIIQAYEKGRTLGIEVTDDAMMVEKNDGIVNVVQGDYDNIKITTPEDLTVAENILMKREGL